MLHIRSNERFGSDKDPISSLVLTFKPIDNLKNDSLKTSDPGAYNVQTFARLIGYWNDESMVVKNFLSLPHIFGKMQLNSE